MSIAKGFASLARETAEDYGLNAMQIFTKSPRGGVVKPIPDDEAELFKEACKKYKIKYVIAHSSYLLNFAKPVAKTPWAGRDLETDFNRLSQLGGNGVVVHIGKALDKGADSSVRAKAIQTVIENTKHILDKTESTGIDYILENTAGQGSEIGFTFEELGEVWKGLRDFNPRLRSCLDTAHAWGAGYDFSTPTKAKKVLKEYDGLVGLNTLACFHFNDSARPCGSRVDRHANIGTGEIPEEGMRAIAQYAFKNNIPLILETPMANPGARLRDVEKVKGWF